jgi:hypothetical protein
MGNGYAQGEMPEWLREAREKGLPLERARHRALQAMRAWAGECEEPGDSIEKDERLDDLMTELYESATALLRLDPLPKMGRPPDSTPANYRCGICGSTEHNRRRCPDRPTALANQA